MIIARFAIEITPDLSSLSLRAVYWVIEVIGACSGRRESAILRERFTNTIKDLFPSSSMWLENCFRVDVFADFNCEILRWEAQR